MNRFIAKRRGDGAAPATINRELGLLSSAINYARREWEWNIPNPVEGRKLQAPEARIRWLTQAEAAALILVAEAEPMAPHLADFILHGGRKPDRHGQTQLCHRLPSRWH